MVYFLLLNFLCFSKILKRGAPLVIQWLRLCASIAEGTAQPQVGKLRSHMPHGMA